MVITSCTLPTSNGNFTVAKQWRRAKAVGSRQHGAIAIMFAFAMIVIIGVFALALELPQIYNRKVELQNVADAVALAAARELDGTAAGIDNAVTQARNTAESFSFAYSTRDIRSSWAATALKFGTSRSTNDWKEAGAAGGAPAGLYFVKVDTRDLVGDPGVIDSFVFATVSSAVNVPGSAIAGRSSINAMPLAVCALDDDGGKSRSGELVEYGFRRGVSYDLMKLSRGGTTPLNFLINPVSHPGAAGSAAGTAQDVVAPFVCTGSMAMPRVKGGAISLQQGFPLSQFYQQINSRFDTLVAPCSAVTAPPDANVKAYYFNGSVPWMNATPDEQKALSTTSGGNLWTVADDTPSTGTPGMYGPLWIYAKAVKSAAYSPGVPEPAGGYTPFSINDWGTLYSPGLPSATASYPGGGKEPYDATSGTNYRAPPSGRRGLRDRRVLNIPLLECSAGSTSGNVLAVGKFFMTVPATATELFVEFAGVTPEGSLGGQVELYQ